MYAVVTIHVLTESGARYILRQHKERLYVTRMGEPVRGAFGNVTPVNRVTTVRVPLISVGQPMRITFEDGEYNLFTTPVLDFTYRVDRYLTA